MLDIHHNVAEEIVTMQEIGLWNLSMNVMDSDTMTVIHSTSISCKTAKALKADLCSKNPSLKI